MTVVTDALEALAYCRADLAKIAVDLKWTYEPGLQGRPEPVRALDVELSTSSTPVLTLDEQLDRNPDYVPGPRWALDTGDPRMRHAFIRATHFLTIAEVRLAGAVVALGTNRKQLPFVRPNKYMTFGIIDIVCISMSSRIDLLGHDLPNVPGDRAAWAAHHIAGRIPRGEPPTARHALELAAKGLSKAVTIGRDTEGHGEKPCKICGIRPSAEKTAGRCNTCHVWKVRNKYERPTSIDESRLSSVSAAKQRRLARGEGWGQG